MAEPRPDSPLRLALVAAGVVLFALAARLAFIAETAADPLFRTPNPLLDIHLGAEAARLLLEGAPGPGFELTAQSAPLYPFWLALNMAVFGDSMNTLRVVTAVWASLRFALILLAALHLTRRLWAATAATVLVAALPSLVYFDTVLLKASLDVTLLAAAVAMVLAWREAGTRRAAILRGLALGAVVAAALASQLTTFLMVVPVAAAVALRPWSRPDRLRALAAIAVPVAVAAAVLSLRPGADAGTYPAFVPRAGFDLHIAHHPRSKVTYQRIQDVRGTPLGHVYESRMKAELALGRALTWQEANRYWLEQALGYMASEPGRTAAVMADRARHAFSNEEIRGIDYIRFVAARSHLVRYAPVSFATLSILGAIGLFVLVRRRRTSEAALLVGLVLTVTVTCALLFVNWRYRLPMVIPLALATAVGLEALVERVRAARVATWRLRAGLFAGPVLAAAAAAALAFAPIEVDPERAYRQAGGGEKQSLYAERTRSALQAVRPGDEPELVMLRAKLLANSQHHTRAFRLLEPLMPYVPDDPELRGGTRTAWVNRTFLSYLLWLGDYDRAAGFLDQLHERDPALLTRITSKSLRPLHRRVLETFVLPRTSTGARRAALVATTEGAQRARPGARP